MCEYLCVFYVFPCWVYEFICWVQFIGGFGLIYKRFQIVGFLLGFSVLVILWVWLLRKCKKRIENLDF